VGDDAHELVELEHLDDPDHEHGRENPARQQVRGPSAAGTGPWYIEFLFICKDDSMARYGMRLRCLSLGLLFVSKLRKVTNSARIEQKVIEP
jgi:hypothetical protein